MSASSASRSSAKSASDSAATSSTHAVIAWSSAWGSRGGSGTSGENRRNVLAPSITVRPGGPTWAIVRADGRERGSIHGRGSGGPRSGVWKLWTKDGNIDVYLASRHLGGPSKISFHQSGRWRNALVSTPARVTDAVVVDLADADDPRMAHVWDRTDNAGPGWTYAFAVIVPEPDVFGPSRPGNLGSRVVHRQPLRRPCRLWVTACGPPGTPGRPSGVSR